MEPELRGKFVASLALPELYSKNVGQVVTVSTEELRYVRRKELALTPFEIEIVQLSDCRALTYKSDFAPARALFGAFALTLVLVIAFGLYIYADQLPVGRSIPIAAIAVLAYVGWRNFSGGRRHVLKFYFDDRTLKWKSKPGEFRVWANAVEAILTFGRSKGLYENPVSLE